MTRLAHAWRELDPEQRLAALAALALLLTMFFPWYGLQSLNRKTEAIYSHDISAFGDVSFVEAAIFLVAAGVAAMLLARAEGREFHMPGGDGTVVLLAGGWAGLLIFYRVFSRPAGNGYPVGIEWGFFLAFVAAGLLGYAGWRMRATERPAPPLTRPRPREERGGTRLYREPSEEDASVWRLPGGDAPAAGGRLAAPVPARAPAAGSTPPPAAPAAPASPPAARSAASARPRFPPAPSEQMSFEDTPPGAE
jgi:hypothetical protein